MLGGAEPVLSTRDSTAPSLAQLQDQGVLPQYQDCLAHYRATAR